MNGIIFLESVLQTNGSTKNYLLEAEMEGQYNYFFALCSHCHITHMVGAGDVSQREESWLYMYVE